MASRHLRSRARYLALVVVAAVIVALYLGRSRINDLAGCLAYYDQCTADRIEDMSKADCLSRDDRVAYLPLENVCLVRASD